MNGIFINEKNRNVFFIKMDIPIKNEKLIESFYDKIKFESEEQPLTLSFSEEDQNYVLRYNIYLYFNCIKSDSFTLINKPVLIEYTDKSMILHYDRNRKRLSRKLISGFSLRQKLYVIRGIILCIEMMHRYNIVISNLNLNSFVIDLKGNVFLHNFLLSRLLFEENCYEKSYKNRLNYYPYEKLQYTYEGFFTDIWALGCIIYLIIYSVDLFIDRNSPQECKKSIRMWEEGERFDQKYLNISSDFNEYKYFTCNSLIFQCLSFDEKKRPTIYDIITIYQGSFIEDFPLLKKKTFILDKLSFAFDLTKEIEIEEDRLTEYYKNFMNIIYSNIEKSASLNDKSMFLSKSLTDLFFGYNFNSEIENDLRITIIEQCRSETSYFFEWDFYFE